MAHDCSFVIYIAKPETTHISVTYILLLFVQFQVTINSVLTDGLCTSLGIIYA